MKSPLETALRRLDDEALRTIAAAVGRGDAPDVQVAEVAAHLADPGWLRRTVARLSLAGLEAVGLLAELGESGAVDRDLDLHAGRIAGADADASPSEELLFHGLAWAVVERTRRGRLRRLRILAPLARRLASLADEHRPAQQPDAPSPPDPERLRFESLRPAYRLALAAAALASQAPRLTQGGTLHRSDSAGVFHALALPRTVATSVVEELLRSRLIRRDLDRARLVPEHLPTLDRAFPILLARRIRQHGNRDLASAVRHVVSAAGWVADGVVLRLQALEALARPGQGLDEPPLTTAVASVPGVLTEQHRGRSFFHATPLLRHHVLGDPLGDSSTRPPRILVQPDFRVLVQVDTPPSLVARLGVVGRIVSSGDATVFALEADRVRRAAVEGLDPATLLGLLEAHAAHGVPATVARTLFEWARTKARATLVTGTVLLTDLDEPALLSLVDRAQVTAVGPGAWLVDDDAARTVTRALRDGGVQCTLPPALPDRTARWNEDGWDDAEERLADLFAAARAAPGR